LLQFRFITEKWWSMTIVDRNAPAADSAPLPDPTPTRSPVRLHFVGRRGDYWRLMIRGGFLQAITLGIYRFWLFTDMRRFLWTSTEVEGEILEYTGTAAELLIGFLIAIGILIPIYAVFFLASLEMGVISRVSGLVAFVTLAGFGQYAIYRARRYRLTRTVFRGLRFLQHGSAVSYAIRAMLWWIPIIVTLGLSSPWATANLERYKMRHTFYGNLGGGFGGSGGQLFWRAIWIWLLVFGPLFASAATIEVIDWSIVTPVLARRGNIVNFIAALPSKELIGIAVLVGGPALSVLFGLVLYPAYQAIVMRWWLGGLRLGGAAAASDLPMRCYYGAYLRCLFYVLLFSVALFTVASLVLANPVDFDPQPLRRNDLAVGLAVLAYVVFIVGCSTIYQVVVKMRLWQVAVESVAISGIAALDDVRAGEATSSAVGEGLADALGAGVGI